jgi:hypothetical protein
MWSSWSSAETFSATPRGGLSLVIGRTRLLFDPGTGLFLPVGESRGGVIDLCKFLA